jgi:arsenical pump membrane protein
MRSPENEPSIPSLIWTVAAAATTGVMIRPFDQPEVVWTATGAVLLVLSGLLS